MRSIRSASSLAASVAQDSQTKCQPSATASKCGAKCSAKKPLFGKNSPQVLTDESLEVLSEVPIDLDQKLSLI